MGTDQVQTTFGDLLLAAMRERHITQLQLSVHTDLSQSSISRISTGSRKFSPDDAAQFSRVLGGEPEIWLSIYDETKAGSHKSIADLLLQLHGKRVPAFPSYGTQTVRLLRDDIIRAFGNGQGSTPGEEWEIENFDPTRVKETSYDTKIGFRVEDDESFVNVTEDLAIKKGECIRLKSIECFHMPTWIEADIHPASNLGKQKLFVANGPIIDPNFSGYLTVSVFNASGKDQILDIEAPFLTIRFTVLDTTRVTL